MLRTSPGVVREAIEATEAVRCMVDHRLNVGFDRDICADGARGIAELPCEFLSSVVATADNHNFGSVSDENLGGAGPDPARPAGYNRYLSFEWQYGNRLLVLGSGKSFVPFFQLPHFTLAPALRTTTHLPARFWRRSI